uniref:Adenylyltransferase and sulfurtransferase MOCS3 homolog n=1 Tax=Amphora coffeiformis TaxID=265554 RepID=A0A7S3LCL4_9STRA
MSSSITEATKDEQIRALESKVRELEAKLSKIEGQQQQLSNRGPTVHVAEEATSIPNSVFQRLSTNRDLTAQEIERYSRQLILSRGFGVSGQRKLLSSSVIVIGAGGIGSTLLMYLATAGIGQLGIVDFDNVEISNLHRQVIHRTDRIGQSKAASARQTLEALNPLVSYKIHECQVDANNVLNLVEQYDCVVDCSDNPKTRYLVNDACVLANKPLISGSAVGLEGQITVYNYQNGPCYRCLYPRPSATTGCRSCADAGVFGPVPGLIGILQAIETIKVLTGTGSVLSDRLLMYDSMQANFLSIKKPPKRLKCPVCGSAPTIRSMADSQETLLTAVGPQPKLVPAELAEDLVVTCEAYNKVRQSNTPHILLDVRVKEQYELCHLGDSVHIPLDSITGELDRIESISGGKLPIYCLCRRGIASADATIILNEAKVSRLGIHSVFNVKGGLDSWRTSVDPSFPRY